MPASPRPIRLVVGLGNPGKRYEGTRHNVGYAVLDRLASSRHLGWRQSPVGEGLLAQADFQGDVRIWAAKPATFMNASGEMVAPLARYLRIAPDETLIVSDDLSLPLGRIRIRRGGSSAGQRGLESILQAFGSEDVPRLRLGIGPRPSSVEAAAFVLSHFRTAEKDSVKEMLERAQTAVECICCEGVEAAMNAFNGEAG